MANGLVHLELQVSQILFDLIILSIDLTLVPVYLRILVVEIVILIVVRNFIVFILNILHHCIHVDTACSPSCVEVAVSMMVKVSFLDCDVKLGIEHRRLK